jgi:polar amino acid transport system substrate-binding protein
VVITLANIRRIHYKERNCGVLTTKEREQEMNRKKIIFRTVTLISLALICIIGCRADRDNSLSRIKKAGYIRIAMSPGYPPFAFYNAKHQLAGFDVDVAKEVGKRLGVEVRLVDVDWQVIINGLNSGECDAILGSMAITVERQKMVDFSVPYYYSRSHVVVLKDSKIKNLSDIVSRTVGVMRDSTFENDAKKLKIKNIRLYKTNDETIAALRKGEVEAAITDEIVALYAGNNTSTDIEPVGEPLSNEKIAVSFRKGDESLLKKVNEVIKEMQKDGTLRQLVVKMAANKYEDAESK